MKKLALVLVCAALAGCGDDAVDAVRNMPVQGYEQFTYGKVLDNHKVCEKAEWKAFEVNDVKKVSYVCSLKKGKVSFNFDENVAAQIREEREKEYTERHINYLNNTIDEMKDNIKNRQQNIKRLEKKMEVKDYIAYYIDAKEKEVKAKNEINNSSDSLDVKVQRSLNSLDDMIDIIRDAMDENLVGGNRSAISPYIDAMFGVENYSYHVTGYGIGEIYKASRKEGFTPEQTQAFKAVNAIISKTIHKTLNERIDGSKLDIKGYTEYMEKNKTELADKALIKEQAKEQGEVAVRKYAMTHILKGEEVIVWAWNPVAERYDLERQYMMQYDYGDRTWPSSLKTEQIVYSAVKNISDIDEYMQRSRDIAATELYKMLQNY